MTASITGVYAGDGCPEFTVTPNMTQWNNFYSMNTTLDGYSVPPGTKISAYDGTGTLCGCYIVEASGLYGLLKVYGDNPVTPVDEGMDPGENVTFHITGILAMATPVNPPSDDITWENFDTDNVDLAATTPQTCLNLTDCVGVGSDCLINESATLCKDVYNINDINNNGVMIINAHDIVLDCNGATLNGTGNGRGINNNGNDNVTIKNCIVTNYERGIFLYNANYNTLLNNTANSNYRGIYMGNSDNCNLINNTANLNNYGIHIYYQSDFNNLINNKIENNTNDGIYIEDLDCDNTEINWNKICFNGATTDIYNNGTGSFGDNNTCETIHNWYDAGTAGCTHICPHASVETSTGKGTAYLATSNGNIENLIPVNESSLPENVKEGKPNTTFIYGLFKFNITGIINGSTVTVTIELPGNLPVNSRYWKYGPKCPNTTPQWYQIPMGSNDGDNKITINLTDGGLGDDNCTPDEKIFDDGGPGSQTIDSMLCNGSKQDVFNPGDPICTFGDTNITCDIYKCNHIDNYTGYNLTANCTNISTITGAFDNVSVCTGGNETENCTINSAYDLILDCDRDGYYNESKDAIDNSNTIGGMDGGFYITPEPIAAILFIVGLSMIYGVVRVKQTKKKDIGRNHRTVYRT